MSKSNGAQVVQVPNLLAAKAKQLGGLSTEAMMRLADAAVFDLRDRYVAARAADLARLEALCSELLSTPTAFAKTLQQIFDLAHDIKGQGGTFGYPLITDIGDELCRLIKAIPAAHHPRPSWLSAVATHVRALRLVADKDIRGDGDAIGAELLDGLRAAAARVKQEAVASAAPAPARS
jgi:hypothetical protein